MTKLITNAHTAIFQWAKASASSLPTESLMPSPNEFKITKSTPNPLIRTLRLDGVVISFAAAASG